jgi:hypothetical protein
MLLPQNNKSIVIVHKPHNHHNNTINKNNMNNNNNNNIKKKEKTDIYGPFVRKCPGPIVWNKGKSQRDLDEDLASAMSETLIMTTVYEYVKGLYEKLDICDAPPGADLTRSSYWMPYLGTADAMHRLVYLRTRGGFAPFSITATILPKSTTQKHDTCSVKVKCEPMTRDLKGVSLSQYIAAQNGLRVFAVPLALFTSTNGHANLLFFAKNDDNMVQVWRFDPWGFENYFGDDCVDLERQLSAFVSSLSAHSSGTSLRFWYSTRNPLVTLERPPPRAVDPIKFCLMHGIETFYRKAGLRGLRIDPGQVFQGLERRYERHPVLDPGGYCKTWTFLIADAVLCYYLSKKTEPQTSEAFCELFGRAVGPLTLIKSPAVLNKIVVDYAFSRSLQSVVLFKESKTVRTAKEAVSNHYLKNIPYTSRDAVISKHADASFTAREISRIKKPVRSYWKSRLVQMIK